MKTLKQCSIERFKGEDYFIYYVRCLESYEIIDGSTSLKSAKEIAKSYGYKIVGKLYYHH